MFRRRPLLYRVLRGAASTTILAYGTYQLVSLAWNFFEEGNNDENDDGRKRLLQTPRRQERSVCLAFEDFLPKLRSCVDEYTNVSRARKELKRLRRARAAQSRISTTNTTTRQPKYDIGSDATKNNVVVEHDDQEEMELWEEIKVKLILGTVGTAYCQVLLYLLLYVQWHLLQSISDNHDDDGSTYVRQLVMSSTFEYFFEKTVPNVLKYLETIIQQNLSHWNVMECLEMSLDEFRDGMHLIRQAEYKTSNGSTLIKYLIPYDQNEDILPNNNDNDKNREEQDQEYDDQYHRNAQYILNETWDMLESPTFAEAQSTAISVVFELLQTHGYSQIFPVESEEETKPALANVLSQLKQLVIPTFYEYPHQTTISSIVSNEWTLVPSALPGPTLQYPNPYISQIEKLPIVMELGDACLM